MAVAGTLEIQLLANIARLQKDMDDAKRSVGGAMSAIEKSVGLAARAFGVLGVSVSLGALVLAAKRINDTVDAMNDLADATGASIENISALDRVARMTGANMDTVGQSLIKFNQALGTTTKAGGDAEKVLTALGLNAKTLRDLDPAEALRQTAVALSQFADDGNKARAVQELFGKSLKEVAPFLKDLAESGELVATVTTQQALEAEKFNKELFKMKANMDDVGRAMANPMVSGLNALIERFALAKKEGDGFLVTLLKQTEIARLLGMDKPSNGYTETRKELDLINESLRVGNLTVQERTLALERQAELKERIGQFLNSNAGAGRGVAGYGDLPKGSLVLPPDAAKTVKATKELTEAEKDLIYHIEWRRKAFLESYDAQVKANEEAKKAEQAMADLIAANSREYLDGIQKQIFAAGELIAAAQWELETYGMSRSQIAELTLARLEDAKAQAMMTALTAEDVAGITAQIDAQKRLVEIYRSGEIRDASKKAAEDADREWQRASEQIGQSLTDALMSGGKSGADYIRDLFRTLVLRPLLQPVGNAMAGVIGQLPGAGGGSGLLGQVGQMAGMANFTGMSLANSAGSMFANATGGGLDALLATNGAFGTAAGGGGIMGTLSAALPWVGGALAIASLLDKPGGGPKTIGGASDAATIQATVQATLAQFGIRNAGLRVGGFSATDPQGDSLTQLESALFVNDALVYTRSGRGLGGHNNVENVGRSQEELAAAWAEEQARITLAALQETLEPKYRAYLAEVNANTSGVDAINAAINRVTQARQLELQLLELSSTPAENLARARAREMEALDATLRPLLAQIHAQEDLKKAAAEAASAINTVADAQRRATDAAERNRQTALSYWAEMDAAAFNALERSVNAQRTLAEAARDAASESVNTLRSLFDLLDGNIKDLYAAVPSTRRAAAQAGNLTIGQALAGGSLDGKVLEDAISASRADIGQTIYKTERERQFAQLVLAGQLSGIKAINEGQLTEAERALRTAEDQLKSLDGILDMARLQLDATRGQTAATLSLAEAQAAFAAQLVISNAARTATTVTGSGGTGTGSGYSAATIRETFLGELGNTPSAAEIYALAYENRANITLAGLDAAFGWASGTSNAYAVANGLPRFATGAAFTNGIASRPTMFPMGLMGEQDPEAILPLANVGGQLGVRAVTGGTNTQRLEKLVEDLTNEVVKLRDEVVGLREQARRTAEATNGRPERPMLVETVA